MYLHQAGPGHRGPQRDSEVSPSAADPTSHQRLPTSVPATRHGAAGRTLSSRPPRMIITFTCDMCSGVRAAHRELFAFAVRMR